MHRTNATNFTLHTLYDEVEVFIIAYRLTILAWKETQTNMLCSDCCVVL